MDPLRVVELERRLGYRFRDPLLLEQSQILVHRHASRDPPRGRAYLWVMGPFLKGAGAIAFLLAYREQPSPRSLLLFAASDGTLAILTFWVLSSKVAVLSSSSSSNF